MCLYINLSFFKLLKTLEAFGDCTFRSVYVSLGFCKPKIRVVAVIEQECACVIWMSNAPYVNCHIVFLGTRTFCRKTLCRKTLCRKTLCRKTFCRTDILPNGHFADGHLVERTFCRTDSMTSGLFAEKTFCRNDTTREILRIATRFSKMCNSQSLCNYKITIVRSLPYITVHNGH